MEIVEFEHRLDIYIDELALANREAAKAFLFLEFIRSVFSEEQLGEKIQVNYPHRLYPELEKYIKSDKTLLVRGRIDALLGNLIIEFENNLKGNNIEEAKSQLKKYTAILWNNKGIVDYSCIATDGFNFMIYRPRTKQTAGFTENDIILEQLDKFDIREEKPTTLYKRLDRYILYRTLKAPTSEEIVSEFGPTSIILKKCLSLLSEAWDLIGDGISTIYGEWSKYLSIVYGSDVDNKDLFLKHTYLATLAKMMVYSYYQDNALPTSQETICRILTGEVFKEYGIENFLVEDFFSWVMKKMVIKQGVKIAYTIIDGLENYDHTRLTEDVFRELYQQLVDPVERHDLGEYYTPEWLAEKMITTVVKSSGLRILDPACGSGTFLATAIR